MSLDERLVLSAQALDFREGRLVRSAPHASPVSAEAFKLTLSPAPESGLRRAFDPPRLPLLPLSGQAGAKADGRAGDGEVALGVGRGSARLMFASQVLIVVTLSILVCTMAFMSYRLNSSVNYYYSAAQPYLDEVSVRSMEILRNAHNSTVHMEHALSETDTAASSAMPALARSVNATTQMVAHLSDAVRSPTLKLSLV